MKILLRKLHQSWVVVMGAVGVVIGVVLALIFRVSFFSSGWFLVLAVSLLIFTLMKPKLVFMAVALIAGMILAFFRVAGELEGEAYVRQYYGSEVVVMGEVSGDPETDEKGTKLKLVGLKFGEQKVSGSIYVILRADQTVQRSDTVVLCGKMGEGFATYAGYMYRPRVVRILRPEPGDMVLKVRDFFAERVRGQIPETQANLGLSYLLGMRAGLPDELDENLRIVGLTHIVVASGAHLAILVEIAKKIFGKISRFAGLFFSVILIVLFMVMVGWTPSIMRAGAMTILALSCWYVGRKMAPWRMILLVAAGTLLINPSFVMNVGWLLSFASFAGIMMVGPVVTKWFYSERRPGFIASMILTTVSATVMTLPVVLYFYGQVSLISVIANLLILPTLPYVMGLVFVAGLAAGVPLIGEVMGTLATWGLDYHIKVVEMFASMKQFLVKTESGNPWVFLLYIVVGVLAMWYFWRRRRQR